MQCLLRLPYTLNTNPQPEPERSLTPQFTGQKIPVARPSNGGGAGAGGVYTSPALHPEPTSASEGGGGGRGEELVGGGAGEVDPMDFS